MVKTLNLFNTTSFIPSFAQITASQSTELNNSGNNIFKEPITKTNNSSSMILIEPNIKDNKQEKDIIEIKNTIMQNIKPQEIGITVKNIKHNSNKNILIEVKNQTNSEKLIKAIEETPDLNDKLHIKKISKEKSKSHIT